MKCRIIKKIFILLASCFLLLTSVSCTVFKKPQATQEIKIYFTKSKGPGEISFAAVKRKIPRDENFLTGSLRELFLGPTKSEELKGVMSEIPIGTRLINILEKEDGIVVNLSSQYLTGGGSATMQLRYLQLYKTLKNLSPDKKFYLQVEGKEIKTIGGEGIEVTQPLTMISDYTKKYEKVDEP